ncbi:nitrate- and nitrite sensing domain-containing protein [Spirillospora sp. CA-108201]
MSLDNAEGYSRTGQLATLGNQLTALAHDVEAERDVTAERAAGGGRAAGAEALAARQEAVDADARKVRAAAADVETYSSSLRLAVGNVLNRVDDLPALRTASARLGPGVIIDKYTEFVDDFTSFHVLISQDAPTAELAQSALALADLANAKDAASRERALLSSALWDGRFEPLDRASVDDARAEMDTSINAFRSSATPAQLRLFEDTVTGPELDRAEVTRLQTLAVADSSRQLQVRLGVRTARSWTSDSTARVDKLRTVEKSIAADLAAKADDARSGAQTAAIRDGVLLFLVLAVVLATLIVMARSLVRPLRRLQSGALDVANARLPGLVDRLRDPEAAAGGIEVKPIEIDSTDEIGQVARAFDEVHREAVRLAADEAVLRGNINAMFVNLSRRSQSLIERQLRLIEELEQSERDEEQLGNLFRLDHLATRMRRNCENLLVLGGQEQVRRWNQPVPLIDVVRASLSEVEQYERVALRVQGDMTVAGPVVNDLVHLLAELVENATVFSSENTKVTVSGQMLSGGGCMLQITDNGVGMSPEELEQANWRLANPPVIDFSAARRMGLFVVGRLAVRHGIRVELRAAQGGGLTAFVVLPDAVVTPGESGGIATRAGLAPREAGSHNQLAALTTTAAEPPAGGFRQDDYGPAATMGGGTGAHPLTGGTGAHPMVGGTGPLRPVRGATGPQPSIAETGPIPAPSPHDPYGTGAQPAVPPAERRPARDRRPPAHDPYGTGEQQPPRRPGELPVREPGTHLQGRPSDGGSSNGLFQPRNERPDEEDAGTNGAYRPGGRTGAQPVVPEAQPLVPDSGGGRHIPWETGPLEQVGVNPGQASAPYAEDVPPVPAPRPPDARVHEPPPVPEPAVRAAAAAPPESKAPPRLPERSPIFDAMQSEWFMHRSGGASGETPSKGWESPADAGFRAAEAAREPVATSRTTVGLPKRVPGKNRIPGAVGRGAQEAPQTPAGPLQGRPAPGHGPQAPTQGMPIIGGQPQGQQEQGHGQSADEVRNRFASLQRGVHRGRHEARGAGTSGEVPSQGDGETGGTR